jgi:hypothetical protein
MRIFRNAFRPLQHGPELLSAVQKTLTMWISGSIGSLETC